MKHPVLFGVSILAFCLILMSAVCYFVFFFLYPHLKIFPLVLEMISLFILFFSSRHVKFLSNNFSPNELISRYTDLYKNFEPFQNKSLSEMRQIYKFYLKELRDEQGDLNNQKANGQFLLSTVIFASVINSFKNSFLLNVIICFGIFEGWQFLQPFVCFSHLYRIKYLRLLVEDLEGILDTQFYEKIPTRIKKRKCIKCCKSSI